MHSQTRDGGAKRSLSRASARPDRPEGRGASRLLTAHGRESEKDSQQAFGILTGSAGKMPRGPYDLLVPDVLN